MNYRGKLQGINRIRIVTPERFNRGSSSGLACGEPKSTTAKHMRE